MYRTVTRIAESAGATAELSIDNKTLTSYNDPALVKKMLPSLQATAGGDNLVWMDESGFKLGVTAFCNLVFDYAD